MGNISCCQEHQNPKPTIKIPKAVRPPSITHIEPPTLKPAHSTTPGTPKAPVETVLLKSMTDSRAGASNVSRLNRVEAFQFMKRLGSGPLGTVELVKEKASQKCFAMKIIQKSKIKGLNLLQDDRIKEMRRVTFLTPVIEIFQNESRIYIVMEYLQLGDLYYYLGKREEPFGEEEIVGISAQIIMGLQILHRKGVVYQELKPENVLVTGDGHIKLTDYGLSEVLGTGGAVKVGARLGALEYTAPQGFSGSMGSKFDIWSLGVLMFELRFRENLFEFNDRRLQNAFNGVFPMSKEGIVDRVNSKIGKMSGPFRNLLKRIFQLQPSARISLEEVQSHSFFKGIDWEKVEQRQNDAPLAEMRNRRELTKFRDPQALPNLRRSFTRQDKGVQSFQLNLCEFRNQQ